MRNCKECGKRIYGNTPGGVSPRGRGKSKVAWYRWVLRLCRYCYGWKFPKREMWDLPPLRQGSERLLSWDECREAEWAGFNPSLWSEDFRKEMQDYREARMRGEIRI